MISVSIAEDLPEIRSTLEKIIRHLDWQTNYDWDHQKAKQSRIKLLELAHKDNMLVNAFHFNFPGLGRIDTFENNWTWNYTK